jgi:D-3-phosphoglycerate dehydrogenase
MKLIVCDPIAPAAVKAMKKVGIKVDVQDDITPENLEAVIAGYDAMVVRSRTEVRQPLLDKAARLKLIIRGGVGLDNVDAPRVSKYATHPPPPPTRSPN